MDASQKKTIQLDADWAKLERHAWEKFHPKVSAIQTLDEVRELLAGAPPAGSPSSAYYSNLAEFLLTLQVPKGTGEEERLLYARLMERLAVPSAEDRSSRPR